MLQNAKTAWSGVRSASQNVPLSRRPRTGGKALRGRTRAAAGRRSQRGHGFLPWTGDRAFGRRRRVLDGSGAAPS